MKKLFMIFTSILLLLSFNGCGEDAVTVVENEGSFEDLKVQSNKTYEFVTTKGEKITLKVENNILSSKQLEGKTVLLNFWATWCAPCLEEMPVFARVYEKYNDKLEIIAILMEKDKNKDELDAFMKRFNMKFPVVVGDENYRAAKAFDDVKMFPESFLFDKDGKFVKKYVGIVDEEHLESLIK